MTTEYTQQVTVEVPNSPSCREDIEHLAKLLMSEKLDLVTRELSGKEASDEPDEPTPEPVMQEPPKMPKSPKPSVPNKRKITPKKA